MKSSFARKVVYMACALVLFVLMFPVRGLIQDIRLDPRHRIAAETLATPGDVDTTSAMAILVLGGLRGVAANLLWSQALELQKEKQWNKLEAVVQSIVKLQPHFLSIWTFQSWNLAYNVSSEWDGIDDKYYWIKRGIKFADQGVRKNQHSPELRWDRGWYYFHKIGKADERKLLRKLYREDTDPEIDSQGHELPPFNPQGKDNYETAKESFVEAVQTCDRLEVKPKRMGEVPFHSYPAHAQTNFAIAREEEGQFGEVIQRDWLDAEQEWIKYGDREYEYMGGKTVKLDYPPEIFKALYATKDVLLHAQTLQDKLAAEAEKPASKKKAVKSEELATLVDKTAALLDSFGEPVLDILPEGAEQRRDTLREAFARLRRLKAADLNDAGARGQASRASLHQFVEAAHKLERLADEEIYWNSRYASMVNYRYWKQRCQAEATMDMIRAREHFHNGLQAYREGDPETSEAELKAGLDLWKKVLDKFYHVRTDDLTAEETAEIVKRYLQVRQQLDLPPPKPIPFEAFVRRFEPQQMSSEQMLQYELYYRQRTGPPGKGRVQQEPKEEEGQQSPPSPPDQHTGEKSK